MTLRASVSFETDFPNDSEEAPSGDITRPAGQNVILVVCELLRRCGLDVSDPQQLEYYGWEFMIKYHGAKILFVLQAYRGAQSLQLNSWNITPWFRRLFSSNSILQQRSVLEILNESLRRDGRFRNICWFTEEEFRKHHIPEGGGQAP